MNSNLQEVIEKKLWDYIDGSVTASEKTEIEKLIQEQAEWRDRYHELMELHQLIASAELEQPSLRFTKNVMEEIGKYHITPSAKKYINNKIVYGIAAFFITVIVSFVVYGFSQVDWAAGTSSKSPLGIDFAAVDYSKMFDNSYINLFMMLNVILGLMLFDHYLTAKKKNWMSSSG